MSKEVSIQDLLDAGAHFGHLRSKWDPNMSPYIFMEKNGIHIIDLNKTAHKLDNACEVAKNLAKSGRKILYIATKKQAKDIVTENAKRVNMPYVTERWLGGMLTNFATVRKSIKKMSNIDRMFSEGTVNNMAKKERLALEREREKLERVLGGITELSRLPAAVFIVDIHKEHIATAEAQKLNITSFGMVDTNSDPSQVNYPIPSNDDASKSIAMITEQFTNAVEEGLSERKAEKEESKKKGEDQGEATEEASEQEETEETGSTSEE